MSLNLHNPYRWMSYSWWLSRQIDLEAEEIAAEARQQFLRLRAHLVGAFDENSTRFRRDTAACRLRITAGTPGSEVR